MNKQGFLYDSPLKFSAKQRLILFLVPPIVAVILRLIYATCRIDYQVSDEAQELFDRDEKMLAAFWHENLALVACCWRGKGYHGLASYSFDGELATRFARCFGFHPLRGSDSRGGMKALGQLSKAIREAGHVGLTVDGPKGPRRTVKPGISIVSAQTGSVVIPFAAVPIRCWRFSSWDKLIVPKPFSRIIYRLDQPIPPPSRREPGAIDAHRALVERKLNELHHSIESREGVDPQLD